MTNATGSFITHMLGPP